MSKQNPAAKAPTTTKQPAKTPPTPTTTGGTALAALPAGQLAVNGTPSLQGQANRLDNMRLQAIQRQMLAGQIGQQQGNGHLQQVMAFVKQTPSIAPYQPNNFDTTSGVTNGAGTATKEHDTSEDAVTQESSAGEEFGALWGEPTGVPSPLPPPALNGNHGAIQRRKDEQEEAQAKSAEESPAPVTSQPAAQAAAPTTALTAPSVASGAQTGAANKSPAAPRRAGADTTPVTESGQAKPAGADGDGRRTLDLSSPAGVRKETGEKAPTSPQGDPAFQAVVGNVKSVGASERVHAPAAGKAAEAQAAAVSPPGEIKGKAQGNQVGEMAQAETPAFDAASFKQKLMDRIAAISPQNEKAADEFKENNKLGGLKNDMQGDVAQQRDNVSTPLAEKTQAAPDTAGIPGKPVTPLPPAQPGAAPPPVGGTHAAPKRKGQGEVEAPLRAGSKELSQQMTEAGVTDQQLANANEPSFSAALGAKQEAQAYAQSAPQDYRQAEQGQITKAEADAEATAQQRTAAMHGDRANLLGQVQGQQGQAKTKDEQKRSEIAAHIEGIYNQTKNTVEGILNNLDAKVTQVFDAGASAAKQAFENYVDAEMEKYKEKRYAGLTGLAKRGLDWAFGLPDEVDRFYQEGRNRYLSAMGTVIDNVVSIIGTELTKAKAAITTGKQDIQNYLATLPQELRQVGQEAAQEIQGKFDDLEQSIVDKQDTLLDTLANKYAENLQAIDARIQQLQEENKGFVDKAKDALAGAIQTILEFKNMLLGVLARAAAAVEKIIKDPIGFLGNLVAGVKQGLQNFVGNIGTHLKEGFIGWLTGAVSAAGISLPQNWDLPGIFQLVMQLLGLTFESLMGKVSQLFGFDVLSMIEPVKQIIELYQTDGLGGLAKMGLTRVIGEERMEALLEVWQMIQTFISGNWNALWGLIQEHLSGLKEMVFGKLEEFLTERVIKAGITWIVSLLNPAGAFIKACKAIYDIVMFFIERAAQMGSLVNAVLDSVTSIASGNLGGAAAAVENALGKSIPVAIGFLSSLLGLGNVSEKVQEIIQGVRGLVDKALNAIFNSKPVQMVVGFIKKVIGKITGLVKSGVNWVKGKVKAGVGWVKGKVGLGGEKEDAISEDLIGISEDYTAKDNAHHRLYIDSGEDEELMMASSPLSYTEFLDGIDPGDDQAKKAALVAARRVVAEFYQKRNERYPENIGDAERQKRLAQKRIDLDAILRRLWIQTDILLGDQGDIPTGETMEDAIPITWYKPLHNRELYPPIEISDNDWFDIYDSYQTFEHPHQPGLEITLGIDRKEYEVHKGRVFARLSNPGRGSKTDEFRHILTLLGVDLSGLDADHVLDLNFGGADDFDNIWLFDRSANRSAGSRQNRQIVTYRDTKTNQVRAVEAGHPSLVNKLFRVERVEI